MIKRHFISPPKARASIRLGVFLPLSTSAALAACAPIGQARSTTQPIPHEASQERASQERWHEVAAARKSVLAQLAERLEAAYLFPEAGAQYARHLRDRKISREEANLSPEAFAQQVTKELQDIHPDGHLRLEASPQRSGPPNGPAGGPASGPPPGPPPGGPPPENLTTHHAGDTAYLRLDALWGSNETMSELETFTASVAQARTLIIDFRGNRGGGLREMDFLFSHIFAEPTDLVVMEVRRAIYESDGMPFGEGPTMRNIDAPQGLVRLMHFALPAASPRLKETRILILTSPTTASAAEHFALALKRTGRAQLIGETSRGAAHFGGLLPVGEGFRAFIPAGRTFDPDTGESWEASGVAPEIEIPQDQALQRALSEAGLDAAAAREFALSVE